MSSKLFNRDDKYMFGRTRIKAFFLHPTIIPHLTCLCESTIPSPSYCIGIAYPVKSPILAPWDTCRS